MKLVYFSLVLIGVNVVCGIRIANKNEVIFTPFCNATKDMVYANCFNLHENGFCKTEYEKLRYYCPVTCKACKGPMGQNRVSRPPLPKCRLSKYGCCKDNETKALGPGKAGCPEVCFDTPNYSCSFYKKHKLCEKKVFYDSLLLRCPLTCGFCEPATFNSKKPGGCYDVWSEKFCKKFYNLNLCQSQKWGSRLAEKCKKTCRKCLIHAPSLLSVARDCSHNGSCCWDRSTPKNGHCPPCNDRMSKSLCYNFAPDCNDVNEIKGVQVRVLCTRTCGLCDVPNKCVDDMIYGEYCRIWKLRGECEQRPIIMDTYCKKTCGFCKG